MRTKGKGRQAGGQPDAPKEIAQMHDTSHPTGVQGLTLPEAAVTYAARGWPVFPVHSVRDGACTCRKGSKCKGAAKHPRARHGHKDATTDVGKIKAWWRKWPDANIGVATGAVSGIVVVDVDPRHNGQLTLQQLQDGLGVLPAGPVVNTGGGGWHLVFKHPGRRVPSRNNIAEGIDIKADGGYIVAPPSNHSSGGNYRWRVGPDAVSMPQMSESWLRFLSGAIVTETAQDIRDIRGHQKDTQKIPPPPPRAESESPRSEGQVGINADDQRFIEDCICKALPSERGTRHDRVFQLARLLQGNERIAGWPLRQLRPIVDLWYKHAVKRLGAAYIEATIDENWFDFAEGWDKVKYPGEGGLMTMVLERVRRNDLPAVAMEYHSPEVRFLIAVCRELQKEAGEAPFYLATSTVAKLLSLEHRMQAHRWLDGLVRDGVLELVERGDPKKRIASRFRYLGD